MTRDGTVASTPEELDAWLAGAPDIRAIYEKGGYGEQFTAADVLPLLEVFVAQQASPSAETAPARSNARSNRWVLLAVVAVIAALVVATILFARI